ncbi:TPA: hypothetical protein ACUJMC_001601 [Streptococcus agalactiae]
MNKLTEWVKSHKPHTAGIIVAFVAVIALSVAGATGVFSNKPADTTSDTPTVTAKVPTKTDKTPVTINVTADDKVNENSTPTIVHVESTDERKEPVNFYHAVDSGKKTDTVEVSPGDYKVTVTGVINNDGSVTKPAPASKEINVSIKSTDKSKDAESKAVVDVELDKTTPADKVTADDVKEIADATKTAIENGDDSLKGDAGKAILDKVEANTKANTHLSEDAKATVTESTEKAQASTETKAKTTVTDAPKSASKPSAPASGNPAEKAKTWVPEKGHWENTTEKAWVPNVVTVTDQAAWDETVTNGYHYVFSDGHIEYDDASAEAYSMKMMQNDTPVSYHWEKDTKTVHHPAVTHTEDRGHYENKVTGKKWVVDVPGHYE